MTLPYTYNVSFDQGGKGAFDTETDVSGALDFPHYTDLARVPNGASPYRGAYCMRIAAPGNNADHILTEGDINITAGSTAWIRFALFISDNFAATADDIFNIFELQASSTVETAISLQITAATDLVEIGIGETEASAFNSTLRKNVWHVIELSATIDAGTTNNGTSTLYVNGNAVQTLSSLNQGAITDGVLGTRGTLATTDAGFLLFDEFVFNTVRASIPYRWVETRQIQTSSFVFVGPGTVTSVKTIDGGSGDVTVELIDADTYGITNEPVWSGGTSAADTDTTEQDLDLKFRRGCLAVVGGTSPVVLVTMKKMTAWGSDGAVRNYALNRTPKPV